MEFAPRATLLDAVALALLPRAIELVVALLVDALLPMAMPPVVESVEEVWSATAPVPMATLPRYAVAPLPMADASPSSACVFRPTATELGPLAFDCSPPAKE